MRSKRTALAVAAAALAGVGATVAVGQAVIGPPQPPGKFYYKQDVWTQSAARCGGDGCTEIVRLGVPCIVYEARSGGGAGLSCDWNSVREIKTSARRR